MNPPQMLLQDGTLIHCIHFCQVQDREVLACMPEVKLPLPDGKMLLRSNDPRAVNCPHCLKTNAYTRAR